jgi:hypothetical protein
MIPRIAFDHSWQGNGTGTKGSVEKIASNIENPEV